MSTTKFIGIGLLGLALLTGCSGGDADTHAVGPSGVNAVETGATVELTAESRSLEEVQAEIAASGKVVILDLWATW